MARVIRNGKRKYASIQLMPQAPGGRGDQNRGAGAAHLFDGVLPGVRVLDGHVIRQFMVLKQSPDGGGRRVVLPGRQGICFPEYHGAVL